MSAQLRKPGMGETPRITFGVISGTDPHLKLRPISDGSKCLSMLRPGSIAGLTQHCSGDLSHRFGLREGEFAKGLPQLSSRCPPCKEDFRNPSCQFPISRLGEKNKSSCVRGRGQVDRNPQPNFDNSLGTPEIAPSSVNATKADMISWREAKILESSNRPERGSFQMQATSKATTGRGRRRGK